MTSIWISPEILERLAGSLLHFVWQGAAVAFVAAVALRLFRRRLAEWRYAVASVALFAMFVAPFVTFTFYAETGALTLRLLRSVNGAVTTAASDASAGDILVWTRWIVSVWVIGVAVFLVRLLGGWILSRRMLRSASAAVIPIVVDTFARARAGLNFHGKVRLLSGESIETPVVIGWLKPAILLPASALTGLNADHLLAILAHELAHIRRHDYLVNGVQRAVECVLFYHPAVWWISGRMRVERELCCDDLAVRVCGDRLVYARALVAIEKARSAATILAVPTAGAGVADRVRRILGLRGANRDWQSVAAALVFAAVLVGAGMLQPSTLAVPAVTPIAILPPPAVQAPQSSMSVPATPLSALIAIATAEGLRPPEPAAILPLSPAPQVIQPSITAAREAAREKLGLLRVDYSASSFVKQAAEGDTIAVKTFLAAGMEIDSRDSAGFTALIKAAQMRKTETAQSLLAAGANPNLTVAVAGTGESTPPVFAALERQRSALSFAAEYGDLPTMKVLLAGGASVHLKDGNSESPIIVAARYGQREAVLLLLENKASIESTTDNRRTAFYMAVCNKRLDVARILLDRGADVNARPSDHSPLLCAAQNPDVELIRSMLDKGADINARDGNGNSPLLSVLNVGSDPTDSVNAVALLLIDRGADVNSVRFDGRTPLFLAIGTRRIDVVRALLTKGANPDTKDRNGNTPLTMALDNARSRPEGNADIALLLIDRGADVNTTGPVTVPGPGVRQVQTTPLLLAIQAKRADIVRALLARGANPNMKSSDGLTPLAAVADSPEIMQLLINAGAKQ